MLASARVAVLIAAWLATLPFLGKAFHIDDEAFLAMARQAAVDPWRPYSFDHHFHDAGYTGFAPAWRIHHPRCFPSFWRSSPASTEGNSARSRCISACRCSPC